MSTERPIPQPNPLTEHRAAYEAVAALTEQQRIAMNRLNEARQAALAYLGDKLAEVEGIQDRKALPAYEAVGAQGAHDPVHVMLEATESRYYSWIGGDRPPLPLAIQITNNHALLDQPCPHCGKMIESTTLQVIPAGTRPR